MSKPANEGCALPYSASSRGLEVASTAQHSNYDVLALSAARSKSYSSSGYGTGTGPRGSVIGNSGLQDLDFHAPSGCRRRRRRAILMVTPVTPENVLRWPFITTGWTLFSGGTAARGDLFSRNILERDNKMAHLFSNNAAWCWSRGDSDQSIPVASAHIAVSGRGKTLITPRLACQTSFP